MKAYHFVGNTLRDGRAIPPDGEWLVHKGPLVMCKSGLHASVDPFDALKYAPGSTLCLVECDGKIIVEGDKLVCRRRKIVKRIDATKLLRKFAREMALSVIHLWDAPKVVRDYLETGDEGLRAAAEAAARAAAWDAAGAAAWAAAGAAAGAAAWDAAWDAAGNAARAAARAAAWDAAWDAARAAAKTKFGRIVEEEFNK